MIKIRLFKNSTIDYLKLLEETSLTNIESKDDIPSVISVAGKMLTKYMESMTDPNLVSTAVEAKVNDWNTTDYYCFLQALNAQGYTLLVSNEETDVTVNPNEVAYMLIDSATLTYDLFPQTSIVTYSKESVIKNYKILDAINNLLGPYNFYPENKFLYNPITDKINKLKDSLNYAGTLNQYELTNLLRILETLKKKFIVYTND